MGFEFKRDDKVAVSNSQGGGIETGVHTVTIVNAFVNTTEAGNYTVDLELKTSTGATGFIYGMCIDEKWKSGSENLDYPKWQELAACADMKTGAMHEVEREVTEKDGKKVKKMVPVFTELSGFTTKMVVRVIKDVNKQNGKARISRSLFMTFLPSGHTLAEKNAGSEAKKITKMNTLKDYETKAYQALNGGNAAAAGVDSNEDVESPSVDDSESLI